MAPDESDADAEKKRRKRRFFRIRVSILLFILFVVGLYAIRDVRSRGARKKWERTLDVVVVLVHVDGTARAEGDVIRQFKGRAAELEARMHGEARRHRPGMPKPFHIRVVGPVDVRAPPPTPASEGALDLTKQAIDLTRWLSDVDPRAGITPRIWDTRIYVTVAKPASEKRSFVEGQSQQDGRVGMVSVELHPDMADVTWFVVTHELLHTLGATDKYDASGRTAPDGIVEPRRVPLYPQRFAEIMAHGRPLSPTEEVLPESIAELAVGDKTAREIGWLR